MTDDDTRRPSTAFLVMLLGRRIREHAEKALAAEGIALQHFSALGHLARDPGLSYSQLARRASVTPQSMQTTLRTLEERGAVEKRTEGGRGRTAQLFLTDDGRRLLDVGRGAFARLDDAVGDIDPTVLLAAISALGDGA